MMKCFWILVLAAGILAACSSSSTAPAASTPAPPTVVSEPAAPRKVALAGTVSLTDPNGWGSGGDLRRGAECRGWHGYEDVNPGAEVVVSDDAGRTLAITHLGGGHISPAFDCLFKFRARVPAGKHFYGVEVTHRGIVKEPESKLGHVALSLG